MPRIEALQLAIDARPGEQGARVFAEALENLIRRSESTDRAIAGVDDRIKRYADRAREAAPVGATIFAGVDSTATRASVAISRVADDLQAYTRASTGSAAEQLKSSAALAELTSSLEYYLQVADTAASKQRALSTGISGQASQAQAAGTSLTELGGVVDAYGSSVDVAARKTADLQQILGEQASAQQFTSAIEHYAEAAERAADSQSRYTSELEDYLRVSSTAAPAGSRIFQDVDDKALEAANAITLVSDALQSYARESVGSQQYTKQQATALDNLRAALELYADSTGKAATADGALSAVLAAQVSASRGAGASLVELRGITEAYARSLTDAQGRAGDFQKTLGDLSTASPQLAPVTAGAGRPSFGSLDESQSAISGLSEALRDQAAAAAFAEARDERLTTALEHYIDAAETATDKQTDFTSALEHHLGVSSGVDAGAQENAASLESYSEQAAASMDQTQSLGDVIEILANRFPEARDELVEMSKELGVYSDKLERSALETGNLSDAVAEASRRFPEASGTISKYKDALENAGQSGMRFEGILGNIIKRSPYVIGTDLLARVLGFQSLMGALNDVLDYTAKGLRELASFTIQSIFPEDFEAKSRGQLKILGETLQKYAQLREIQNLPPPREIRLVPNAAVDLQLLQQFPALVGQINQALVGLDAQIQKARDSGKLLKSQFEESLDIQGVQIGDPEVAFATAEALKLLNREAVGTSQTIDGVTKSITGWTVATENGRTVLQPIVRTIRDTSAALTDMHSVFLAASQGMKQVGGQFLITGALIEEFRRRTSGMDRGLPNFDSFLRAISMVNKALAEREKTEAGADGGVQRLKDLEAAYKAQADVMRKGGDEAEIWQARQEALALVNGRTNTETLKLVNSIEAYARSIKSIGRENSLKEMTDDYRRQIAVIGMTSEKAAVFMAQQAALGLLYGEQSTRLQKYVEALGNLGLELFRTQRAQAALYTQIQRDTAINQFFVQLSNEADLLRKTGVEREKLVRIQQMSSIATNMESKDLAALNRRIEDSVDMLDKLSRRGRFAADLSSALVDPLREAGGEFENLADIATESMKRIQQAILNAFVFDPVQRFFDKLFTNLLTAGVNAAAPGANEGGGGGTPGGWGYEEGPHAASGLVFQPGPPSRGIPGAPVRAFAYGSVLESADLGSWGHSGPPARRAVAPFALGGVVGPPGPEDATWRIPRGPRAYAMGGLTVGSDISFPDQSYGLGGGWSGRVQGFAAGGIFHRRDRDDDDRIRLGSTSNYAAGDVFQSIDNRYSSISSAINLSPTYGATYGGSNVHSYTSGDVVMAPTYFAMGGDSTGLMSEREPEAVMPLARGPSGRLGVEVVKAGGDGPRSVTNINMTVRAPDPSSFRRSSRQIMSDLGWGRR